GRDRLLEAYRKVRSTTDEVAEELQRVEDEAREAAGAAGERVAASAVDDIDDVLAAFADGPPTDEGGSAGEAATDDVHGGAGGEPRGADGTEHAAGDAGADAEQAAGATPGPASVPFEVKAGVAAQLAGQAADEAEEAALAAESAAVEAAGGARAPDAGPPPQLVSTRPGGDRRPLRLLRRAKGEGRPLDVVPAPAQDEEVRVIPPDPEPVVVAAATSVPSPEVLAPAAQPGPRAGADEVTADAGTSHGPRAGADEMAADAGTSDGPRAGVDEMAATDGPRAVADQIAAADRPRPVAAEAGGADATRPAPGDESAGGRTTAGGGEESAGGRTTAGGEAEAAAAAVAGVDELFARIRAGRADAVARAHEVLGADPGAPVQPSSGAEPSAAPDAGAASPDAAVSDPSGPAEEETLLQRRDAAVEGLQPRLARKLKRALQDEQNEVLDRLRSAKAGAPPEAVLAAPDEQAERYRQAAADPLHASAAAGMAFVAPAEGGPSEAPDIAAVVGELVSSLAEPLRRALERAVRGDGADHAAVGERIGAAYRECKAQRIEGLAGDAVTAAFSCGALAAMPAGVASRWVVDDDGRPCPDCDDNALAGATAAGEAFPTGQAHPPAHAGCRCLLAPAALAVAVPGNG
ncbi:MAG: hypothetical protein ACR2MO_13625, partial [Acidimicrobiales bacterium]